MNGAQTAASLPALPATEEPPLFHCSITRKSGLKAKAKDARTRLAGVPAQDIRTDRSLFIGRPDGHIGGDFAGLIVTIGQAPARKTHSPAP